MGFTPGPEHFGYQVRALVADTDEKAQELGRGFLWAGQHRMRGPGSTWTRPVTSRPPRAGWRRDESVGAGARRWSEDLQEVGAIIVGSPDTVSRRLSETIEQLNPDT